MESEVTTRLARSADGIRISALFQRFRAEHGDQSEATLPLPVGQDGQLMVILAEDEGEPVGLLAAQRVHRLAKGGQLLLLTDIYVDAGYRHRGVGAALMAEATTLGRQLGCDALCLIVENINNAALATAARAGFSKHNDLLLTLEL